MLVRKFLAIPLVLGALALITLYASNRPGPTKPSLELPTLSQGYQTTPTPGKPTWVNFWSVTCPPCMEELPVFDELQKSVGNGIDFQIIAIQHDPPHLLKETRDRLGIELPVRFDLEGTAMRSYDPDMAIPRHFLLNAKGKIVFEHTGKLDRKAILAAIKSNL